MLKPLVNGTILPQYLGSGSSGSSGMDDSSVMGTVSTELSVPDPDEDDWLEEAGPDEELELG